MSELMRFRLVRAPQRQRPEGSELIRPASSDAVRVEQLAALPREQRAAEVEANPQWFAGNLSAVPAALTKLDEELGRSGNRLHPDKIAAITGSISTLVASTDFASARARLFNTLAAIVGGGITDATAFGYDRL